MFFCLASASLSYVISGNEREEDKNVSLRQMSEDTSEPSTRLGMNLWDVTETSRAAVVILFQRGDI